MDGRQVRLVASWLSERLSVSPTRWEGKKVPSDTAPGELKQPVLVLVAWPALLG